MKIIAILCSVIIVFMVIINVNAKEAVIDLEAFQNYQKEYYTEEMKVCATYRTKTYMPITAITNKASKQYKFIQSHISIDPVTGLSYDEDGFIGVALGSYFGEIGERFYFTLDTGIVLPVVIVDRKSDSHTINGCYQKNDTSVIEFVVDKKIASNYFGVRGASKLILGGNFNNSEYFKGKIVKVEKVLPDKIIIEENVVENVEISNEIIGSAEVFVGQNDNGVIK